MGKGLGGSVVQHRPMNEHRRSAVAPEARGCPHAAGLVWVEGMRCGRDKIACPEIVSSAVRRGREVGRREQEVHPDWACETGKVNCWGHSGLADQEEE